MDTHLADASPFEVGAVCGSNGSPSL